jgi:hypothetical protein
MTARDDGNQIVGSDEPSVTPVTDEKADPNSDLRAYNKRLVEKVKGLEATEVDRQLTEMGLSREDGMGKAIVNTFDGDVEAGAIAEFAQNEYGIEQASAEVSEEVQAGDRLDQALAVSTPVVPTEPAPAGQESITKMDDNDPEATREDALRSIRAKSGQFQETFYKT